MCLRVKDEPLKLKGPIFLYEIVFLLITEIITVKFEQSLIVLILLFKLFSF